MVTVHQLDLLYQVLFMIVEYFYEVIIQQIQIDLVTVIPDISHETPLFIKKPDLFVHFKLDKFLFLYHPSRNQSLKISKTTERIKTYASGHKMKKPF